MPVESKKCDEYELEIRKYMLQIKGYEEELKDTQCQRDNAIVSFKISEETLSKIIMYIKTGTESKFTAERILAVVQSIIDNRSRIE